MEIERKFLIKESSFPFKDYPHKELMQGYLCTSPVVRIRKEDDEYFLTYKGRGLLAREEYNLPLTKDAFEHMLTKVDGHIIHKNRYLIPLNNLTIELDEFLGHHAPLLMAEVEFSSIEEANSFTPPEWFGDEVTENPKYHNSNMI